MHQQKNTAREGMIPRNEAFAETRSGNVVAQCLRNLLGLPNAQPPEPLGLRWLPPAGAVTGSLAATQSASAVRVSAEITRARH
jgi:hypothetical protein